ncbi:MULTISPECIES: DNA-binding protein [unclassified Okeania]|uniref:DNA-binding protein n=1 Tax=unclassified Okeania TaxID=2634635 RepID=UPI0025795135|nr:MULTISPECIES: DNA-binding protein [unclassified Okeania]
MNFIKVGRVAKSLTGAIAAYISFFSIVIVTPTLAKTPIGELQRGDNATISGQVIGISGDEFMLDDGTGQILVDTDDRELTNLSVGEQVTVIGEYDDDDFDAYSITRQDGSVINIRSDDDYDDDDDDDDDDN